MYFYSDSATVIFFEKTNSAIDRDTFEYTRQVRELDFQRTVCR